MRMDNKGFTLVELMVVLAILGLLAGVGIPQYLGALSRAKTAADTASLASVQSALDVFRAETGWTTASKVQISAADGTQTAAVAGIEGLSLLTGTTVEFGDVWGTGVKFPTSKVNPAYGLFIDTTYKVHFEAIP